MVKGISKRVIVIKSPDKGIFDEAIFIVKDGAYSSGFTSEDIIRQAQQVAGEYVQRHSGSSFFRKLPPPVCAALGAAATGLIWFLSSLIF